MIDQQLFNKLKREAKTHTPTYLVIKYELEGINLTEDMITRIKNAKSLKDLKELVYVKQR